MTSVCLLIAAERSGTHLLRSMLARAGGIWTAGEIANGASGVVRTEQTSFLRFRRERWTSEPDGFYAAGETQQRLLDDYFAMVRDSYPGRKYVLLDVKYSHVHNFNSFWWDPSTTPLLIEYARAHRIKVMHLVRAKVYETVISTMYAHQSGVWRARNIDQLKKTRIEVSKDELMRRADEIAHTIRMFDRWLEPCDYLRLTYEALTAEMPAALGAVKHFLGLEVDIPAQPGYVKTTPPYRESVANFAEIADLIDLEIGGVGSRWATY